MIKIVVMMKVVFFFSFLITVVISLNAQNYAKLVNPEIGTQGEGYMHCGFTYVGASYPFGMVQFTPSFFAPQRGFAINQISGGGCAQKGNFPVVPISGKISVSPNSMDSLPPYKTINEAYAGYLSVTMQDGSVGEFTVNERSGIARFLFPDHENTGTVIIGSGVNSTFVENSMVKITSAKTCEGFAEGGEFCGININNYRVYFAAEFDVQASETGFWMQDKILNNADRAFGRNAGAIFYFDTQTNKEVNYRIAISYVSIENAKQNLKASKTHTNFDEYKAYAEQVWNEYLGKIKVESENTDRVVQFYTHFYHALIHPNIVSDVNGEYMGADYQVHKTERGDHYSTYSVWDSYRTQAQLVAMLFPEKSSDMMQTLVEFADQSGGFGRWILANLETGIMQGDPTAILLSNSYAFGANDFDVESAYRHMRRGATIPHLHSQQVEIRPFLKEYEKGVAPASILLEYASADYAIGQFAKQAIGNETDAQFFMNRAQIWNSIYNPEINWLNSRNFDGSWKDITHDWREATYKDYMWMVPFNLNALIDTIGGKDFAEKRLDTLFVRLDASYHDDWYAAGNEPGFQIPWIYNWTNAPYKSSQTVHRIFSEIFSNEPSGLPGNDDAGAMGSWYVFASIGFYPMIPGVAGFTLSAPQFENITMELPGGTVNIRGGSSDKIYPVDLKLNGKKHASTWIDFDDIRSGATLEYKTSAKINKKWGVK
ncbi:GH92 family glycosyl hydrolase [Seonamhaeicola sediminis]